jgi:hypothetical protein
MFMVMTGYPKGRPGFIIDHVIPIACGGADIPSNMTWQTTEEAAAKDKWERQPCSAWWDGTYTRLIQDGLRRMVK